MNTETIERELLDKAQAMIPTLKARAKQDEINGFTCKETFDLFGGIAEKRRRF
jgi:peroxiredoxin family protein